MARTKIGKTTFYNRNGRPLLTFTPTGAMRPNKVAWTSAPVFAARLFVGFKVGDDVKWTMDELVSMVRQVRGEQEADPGSSFVAQRGVYKDQDTGKVIDEPGAQVIILELSNMSAEKFEEQMIQLGEHLRYEMKQKEVIVELQHGGSVYKTLGIKEF